MHACQGAPGPANGPKISLGQARQASARAGMPQGLAAARAARRRQAGETLHNRVPPDPKQPSRACRTSAVLRRARSQEDVFRPGGIGARGSLAGIRPTWSPSCPRRPLHTSGAAPGGGKPPGIRPRRHRPTDLRCPQAVNCLIGESLHARWTSSCFAREKAPGEALCLPLRLASPIVASLRGGSRPGCADGLSGSLSPACAAVHGCGKTTFAEALLSPACAAVHWHRRPPGPWFGLSPACAAVHSGSATVLPATSLSPACAAVHLPRRCAALAAALSPACAAVHQGRGPPAVCHSLSPACAAVHPCRPAKPSIAAYVSFSWGARTKYVDGTLGRLFACLVQNPC